MDTKSTCLAAHTAPDGSYPPYINATLHGDQVVVIVRGTPYPDGHGYIVSGNEATITMSAGDFKRWLGEAVSELVIAGAKCDDATRELLRKSIRNAMDTDAPAIAPCTFQAVTHSEIIEARAKQIYDDMAYDGPGDKPAWVTHGNSLKQDEARATARAEGEELRATSPWARDKWTLTKVDEVKP